ISVALAPEARSGLLAPDDKGKGQFCQRRRERNRPAETIASAEHEGRGARGWEGGRHRHGKLRPRRHERDRQVYSVAGTAPSHLAGLHSVPASQGSNWQSSVNGYQGPHTCAQGPEMRKQHDLYVVADLSEVVA